ncbi:MAG: SWIM zinc finger family protein [Deltaproteobacteria bacterium]|jgi:hypothetical protein|nr:SWIM zinc finger family protein [Deltaproteobacteria bacterium]
MSPKPRKPAPASLLLPLELSGPLTRETPLLPFQITASQVAETPFAEKISLANLTRPSKRVKRSAEASQQMVFFKDIVPGRVSAEVTSGLLKVTIKVKLFNSDDLARFLNYCLANVVVLSDFISGQFSLAVATALGREETGLLPKIDDLAVTCSCGGKNKSFCPHVLAVFKALIGLFQANPELLLTLRGLRTAGLLDYFSQYIGQMGQKGQRFSPISDADLEQVFGINLDLTGDSSKPDLEGDLSLSPNFDSLFIDESALTLNPEDD